MPLLVLNFCWINIRNMQWTNETLKFLSIIFIVITKHNTNANTANEDTSHAIFIINNSRSANDGFQPPPHRHPHPTPHPNQIRSSDVENVFMSWRHRGHCLEGRRHVAPRRGELSYGVRIFRTNKAIDDGIKVTRRICQSKLAPKI